MKKKLIAAVTSLVMVATLAPATAFASTTGTVSGNDTTATRQAVNQDAVNAATAAIRTAVGAPGADKELIYPTSGNQLETASKLYGDLSDEDKAAVGDALAERLQQGIDLYKVYTDKISEVETAFAAVTKIQPNEDQTTGSAYKKAMELWGSAVVDATTDGLKLRGLTNAQIKTNVSAETKTKAADMPKALAVVNLINQVKADITAANYITAGNATNGTAKATADYNKLTDSQKALVSNYGIIVGMDNEIAAYTKTVNDVAALATAEYKAVVNGGEITSQNVDKVTADVADLKVAYGALNADKQTAVTNKEASISDTNIANVENKIATYNRMTAASKAAAPVIKMIRDLKAASSITLDDGTAIIEARTAYEALDNDAKAFVANNPANEYGVNYVNVLEAAEDKYEALVIGQDSADRVAKLKTLVSVLPSDANTVTVENEAAINEAMAYFNLNSPEAATLADTGVLNNKTNAADWQKLFVMGSKTTAINEANATDEYKTLKACIEVLNKKIAAENANVTAYINTYLTKLSNYDSAGSYIGTNETRLANAKTNLATAKSELAKLTAREQEKVKAYNTGTEYGYIEATEAAIEVAEKAIKDAAAVANIKTLVDAIDITAENLTASNLNQYESKIADADKAYTEASPEARVAFDSNYTTESAKLVALVKKVKDLKDSTSVAGIEATIAAVPVVKTDGTETEESLLAAQTQIKDAQALFDGLSSNVQGQISNAGKLATAQKALADAAKKLAQDEFAKIGNITAGITDAQIAQFNKVKTILDEFGLATSVITATQPTYAQVAAAVKAKDDAAVKAVNDGIKALPATITKNDIADVYDLQNAYNALSDALKAEISAADKAKLDKAVAQADALSLTKAKIDAIADQTYTGNEINVDVVVKDVNGTVIPKDAYEVSYNDNKAVGTATVVVNAKADSKYAGTAKQTFQIVAASIEDAAVTGIATKTYTGKALTQVAKVIVGDKTLALGTDYTVAYKNNTKVGKATMTITAQGNYKGELTKTFVVKPGKATVTSLKAGKKKATVKIKSIPGATYKIAYKQRGNGYKYKTVKTTSLSKTITGLKSGKVYKVKVLAFTKVDGKTYYTGYSTIKTVKVK